MCFEDTFFVFVCVCVFFCLCVCVFRGNVSLCFWVEVILMCPFSDYTLSFFLVLKGTPKGKPPFVVALIMA